jgi:hypothetical protein
MTVVQEDEIAKLWVSQANASPAQEVFEKALAEQWRKTGCDATGAPYVPRALIARLSSPRLGIRLFLSKAVQKLSRLPLSTRRRVLMRMGSPSSTRRRSKKSPRRPHRNRQAVTRRSA